MAELKPMKYIHIKSLEKHHPGYRDRVLMWGRFYFGMVQGDPEFEMVSSETDKWRFVALAMLELQARKPIPLDEEYLRRKGFDLEKRPISLTLQMLHNFIEIVTEPSRIVEKSIPEKRTEERKADEESVRPYGSKFMYVRASFLESLERTYPHVNVRVEFSKMEGWLTANPGKRQRYHNWEKFVINWLNRIDKPPAPIREREPRRREEVLPRKPDPEQKKKVGRLVHDTVTKMRKGEKVS